MTSQSLTLQSIVEAEAIFGVSYSESERALMLDNLSGQIALATKRRAFDLPQDLPPATLFDPRLPGWQNPPAPPFRPSAVTPPPLPDRDEDIAFAPVTVLASWVRSRAITSVRLTEIYLERIARLAPKLECIATATPEINGVIAGGFNEEPRLVAGLSTARVERRSQRRTVFVP